jgi:xanthine dehydrogenase accessory factor
MAVAILAELVQLRASGALPGVPVPRAEPGREPETRSTTELPLAGAFDPVCGMTVTPDASGLPLGHDGVTYYFCCAGCRRTFADNPGAYVKAVLR